MHQDLQYRKRFGAPSFNLHRADLQRVLRDALGRPGLHLGHRLASLVDEGETIGLEFANGRVEQVDLVVGADGIRSVVRRFVTGSEDVEYSGTSAFRGIVPVERLPSLPNPRPFSSGWVRTRTCCITRSATEGTS